MRKTFDGSLHAAKTPAHSSRPPAVREMTPIKKPVSGELIDGESPEEIDAKKRQAEEEAKNILFQGSISKRTQGVTTPRPTVPGVYVVFLPKATGQSENFTMMFHDVENNGLNDMRERVANPLQPLLPMDESEAGEVTEELPTPEQISVDDYERLIVCVEMSDLRTAPYGAWTYMFPAPQTIDERGDDTAVGYRKATDQDVGKICQFSQASFGPWEEGRLVFVIPESEHSEVPFAMYAENLAAIMTYKYCRIAVEEAPVIDPELDIRGILRNLHVEEIVPNYHDGINEDQIPCQVMAMKPAGWEVPCQLVSRTLRIDGNYLYEAVVGNKRQKFVQVRPITPQDPAMCTEAEFTAICGRKHGHSDCKCHACDMIAASRGMF